MQKYYDFHTHSTISFDSQISIEDTCYLAQARGGSGLTFTEHVLLGEQPADDIWPDTAAYAAELAAARLAFPELKLGMGLELDLQPGREADIARCLAGSWDFVLGSVHELGGLPLTGYDGAFAAGESSHAAFCQYFQGLYACVQAVEDFDALGHLDLLRRDRRFASHPFEYANYAELLDPLLKLLVERGQGLEVNTAAWRYGLAEAHPTLAVLRRFRQLGGEIVSCGSDCHAHASAFYRIQDGYRLIKEAGFKYVSLFEKRQLQQLKLEI